MTQKYYFFLLAILAILCSTHSATKIRKNSSSINKIHSIQGSKTDQAEKNSSSKKSYNHGEEVKRKLDEKNQHKNKEKNETEEIPTKRQLDNWEPIEIFVDLTAIKRDFFTKTVYNYITFDDIASAVNEVKETLKKLINVSTETGGRNYIKINSNLTSEGFDNDNYNISLKDTGAKADIIILVRYSNEIDGMSSNYFAKPKIIQKNSNQRPEVGIIILYPEFGLTENNKEEYLKYLFLHEFTHILGFLPEYLNKFTLDVEIRRINEKGIIKKAIRSHSVVDYAKKYFNCAVLKYLELEEQTNFEGLINCHWDARVLLGEYMTSEPYFGDQVISEFTLYLLEDLGFYKTNKYTGGLMKFGKNRGCAFLGYDGSLDDPTKSDCLISLGAQIVLLTHYEFCQGINTPTCSSGRQSRTYCVRKILSEIDSDYFRNLGVNLYGRKNADYCPVSDTLEEDEINHYTGNCKLGDGNYGTYITYGSDFSKDYNALKFDDSIGQIYGENSFCALSSLINKNDYRDSKYKERIRPTCYLMFCSDKSLTIQINEQYFVCPQAGGIIQITNYEGYIYCPDYNLICTGTVFCNNMFDCVDKKSVAKKDLNYIINSNSDGSVIEGVEENSLIPSYLQIVKGYELSDDENSKCPKNCFQCIEERRCFECENNYYYKGTNEAAGTPIKCINTIPTDDYHYSIADYTIFDTIKRFVYFDCIEGCKKCQDGNTCDMCTPTHKFNSETKKCEERIPHCLIYDISSLIPNSTDNNYGPAYTECKECDNSNNYYCLKINGIDDKTTCYDVTNIGFSYKICNRDYNEKFEHCLTWNNDDCLECEEGYHFNNEGDGCILNRLTAPSDDKCEIYITNYITQELKYVNINDLVQKYINSFYPYTKKVRVYDNKKFDYSITIYINSSCTNDLLDYGLLAIDDEEIKKNLIQINADFEKNDPNEIAISVFINQKGEYDLTMYSLDEIPHKIEDFEHNIKHETYGKNLNINFGYLVLILLFLID